MLGTSILYSHNIFYPVKEKVQHLKLSSAYSFFFFTKKVTPIIGVFPSANFPQEMYFSPSNHFLPKKPIFPALIQSIVMGFSE